LAKNDSSKPSAAAAASCSGCGAPTVRKSWTLRIAAVIGGAAMHQPTRQPVTLNVFECPEIVIVRSAMPGSEAIETCSAPS
jgi:hypothetical protein